MHGLCTVISYEVGLVVLLAQAQITTPPSTKLMVRNTEDSVTLCEMLNLQAQWINLWFCFKGIYGSFIPRPCPVLYCN